LNNIYVGYDLNVPGKDYAKLIEKIKSYSGWCHVLKSAWIIQTTKTASQLVDELLPYVDRSDDIFAVDVTRRPAAWFGLSNEISNWLSSKM
jgi:hypothetical protein